MDDQELAALLADLESDRVERKASTSDGKKIRPFVSATMADLDLETFQREYLASALAPEVLAENQRSLVQQLVSLRFATPEPDTHPTCLGILVVGKDPRQFVPGFYI